MAKFTWLVFSHCVSGREAEYLRWYDEAHLPDLLRVPGIVAARRLSLAGPQMMRIEGVNSLAHPGPSDEYPPYLAIYEIEADAAETVLDAINRLAGTPDMPISDDLGAVRMLLYAAEGQPGQAA